MSVQVKNEKKIHAYGALAILWFYLQECLLGENGVSCKEGGA